MKSLNKFAMLSIRAVKNVMESAASLISKFAVQI